MHNKVKFTTLIVYASHLLSVKLDYFTKEKLAHPRCKNL